MMNFVFRWFVVVGLSLLAASTFLQFGSIIPTLQPIQSYFHTSAAAAVQIYVLYLLIYSFSMIVFGRLGDKYGRRNVLYLGILVAFLASLGAATAPTFTHLLVFSLFAALGSSAILINAAAFVPLVVLVGEESRAIGIYGLITGLASALAPFFAVWVIHLISWRASFFVNIPLIIVGFLLCVFCLEEPEREQAPPVNWFNVLLFILGVGGLVYLILGLRTWPGGASRSMPYFIFPVIFIVLWVISEIKAKQSLVEVAVFKQAKLTLAFIISFASGVVTYLLVFSGWIYLHSAHYVTPLKINLLLFITAGMQVILGVFWARLLRKVKVYYVVLVALAIAIISALCALTFTAHTNYGWIVAAFALMGIVWGVGNMATMSINAQEAPDNSKAASIGTIYTIWNLAGVLSQTVAGLWFFGTEKTTLTHVLSAAGKKLTLAQHAIVMRLLHDPIHYLTYAHQLLKGHAAWVLPLYDHAFLAGYHEGLWLGLWIFVILLMLAVWLVKKTR